jgi:hypothetical protein
VTSYERDRIILRSTERMHCDATGAFGLWGSVPAGRCQVITISLRAGTANSRSNRCLYVNTLFASGLLSPCALACHSITSRQARQHHSVCIGNTPCSAALVTFHRVPLELKNILHQLPHDLSPTAVLSCPTSPFNVRKAPSSNEPCSCGSRWGPRYAAIA